jgi:hypothetical protein
MSTKNLINMANTNRNKGHNYERQLVKDFKKLGFENCVTSRYGSKMLDDQGIDLMNTGDFAVQSKCYKRNPQYKKVLADMVVKPTDVPIIFHKAPGGKEYCILHKEDMMEIIQMLISNKIINTP